MAAKAKPNSISRRILTALREGPSTASEMAAILGVSLANCVQTLSRYKRKGQVAVIGQIAGEHRQKQKIYALNTAVEKQKKEDPVQPAKAPVMSSHCAAAFYAIHLRVNKGITDKELLKRLVAERHPEAFKGGEQR